MRLHIVQPRSLGGCVREVHTLRKRGISASVPRDLLSSERSVSFLTMKSLFRGNSEAQPWGFLHLAKIISWRKHLARWPLQRPRPSRPNEKKDKLLEDKLVTFFPLLLCTFFSVKGSLDRIFLQSLQRIAKNNFVELQRLKQKSNNVNKVENQYHWALLKSAQCSPLPFLS